MKQLLIFGVLIFFINGCSSDVKKTEEPKEEVAVLVEPNRILSLEIEGMVCKMGCGGAIRKGLTALDGVNRVTIDYDEERDEQFVTVQFDADIQDEEAIYAELETVNKGQFTVSATKSEAIKNPS